MTDESPDTRARRPHPGPAEGSGLPPAGPSSASSPPLSKQRLFVVVHKTVTEDMLQRLFRQFPGMEYCDLKKDRTTGRSKVSVPLCDLHMAWLPSLVHGCSHCPWMV